MSTVKFLFITTLTPKQYLTPLRELLFTQYKDGLIQQTYINWQALLVGDEDKTEGNFTYIKTGSLTKEDKLIDAYNYILKMSSKPDYIIRLDDDDVISPYILERACNKSFDCYADKYHFFYDIFSGRTTREKRSWLPNTIIHQTKHALTIYPETGRPLLANDHSKTWHIYYKDKNVTWASKLHPVYVRILSPTSITGKELNKSVNHAADTIKAGKWKKGLFFDTYIPLD